MKRSVLVSLFLSLGIFLGGANAYAAAVDASTTGPNSPVDIQATDQYNVDCEVNNNVNISNNNNQSSTSGNSTATNNTSSGSVTSGDSDATNTTTAKVKVGNECVAITPAANPTPVTPAAPVASAPVAPDPKVTAAKPAVAAAQSVSGISTMSLCR